MEIKKKYFVGIVAFAVLLLFSVSALMSEPELSYEEELGLFCEQARDYPNLYDFSEKEQLAWGLSNLVRNEIAFNLANVEVSGKLGNQISEFVELKEVLETKTGACSIHSRLFLACCKHLGLSCLPVSSTVDWGFESPPPIGLFEAEHMLVSVKIDGRHRFLDQLLSERNDYFLFAEKAWFYSVWDYEKIKIFNKIKGENDNAKNNT